MERVQQKRSHGREKPYHRCAATITSHSYSKSTTNLVLTERALREGNLQIRKRVDASKAVSDSSSCSSGLTEEDSFTSESRQGSSKQAGGTPMKKLLAEELSREMESRRRPPSVIARLMGLDPLPPQQPIHKQQKKFSDNYLQRTASIGFPEKSSSYEGRSSSRMSNKEQEDFKDVFEVLETAKVEKHSHQSVQKGMLNSKLSETKMELIRQKFMDVKRLSTDEKLQQSKEFHDALEVLDSNKDLLLKFLQEPDSLFTKHLHDLQGVQPPPQSGHITVLKSSNAHNYDNSNMYWKSEGKTEWKDDTNSFHKHEHGVLSHSHNKHGVHISHKGSKSQFDGNDKTCLLPTRIVVLKPNLRKSQNTARSVSSPNSLEGLKSGYRKHREYRSSENRDLFAEVQDQRNSSIDVELMKHRARGSREIAKDITRRMRRSVNSSSTKVSSSRLRGYAGDESSYTMSGNDSGNESEVMTPTSRHVYDWKSRYSPSSSYSTESSVTKEAKKRLSERWKMTHRFQEVGTAGRGSTLGEMLAMPDRETRPMLTTLDSMVDQDGFSDRLARHDGIARWGSPLGISSRDGWKDECARSLPRSRSLPASSSVFGSPKTSIRHGALDGDRCLMLKESVGQGSIKSRKGDCSQKDGFLSKSNQRSNSKKSNSFLCADGENTHRVQGTRPRPDELRKSCEEKDVSEQKPMTPELLDDDVEETIQVTDEIAIAKPEDAGMSFEIAVAKPDEHLPEPTGCITSVEDGDSSAYEPDDSIPEKTSIGPPEESSVPSHCPVAEPESPASSKETEQPSPVSVLEPPYVEEISSGSDCFERISADLHGLRMQLQLLKSETLDEGFEMVVSSDEDTGEGSFVLPKENGQWIGMVGDKENRDFSYLVDVLVDSGFHDVEQDMLLATWDSPECPVGPSVFEKLEKKYGEQTSWVRSERRLLFDRINYGLVEILQPCMDPHPWVMPMKRRVGLGLGWHEDLLEEELWKLVDSQGKEWSAESMEKVLGKEMRWLELEDDIDVVGREIERLLIDELVAEVVSM